MNFYLLVFIASVIISFIITNIVKNYAIKRKIGLAKIRPRDIHKKPIPRIGGIAIFTSFWIIVIGMYIINSDWFIFTNERVLGIDKNLLGLFIASATWFIIGIIDDLRDIKPWIKLIAQFLCGFFIVIFGIKIWWISNPFGDINFILNYWTYLLVPLWIVLLINVLNWFDGIDGLTPSISLISLLVLFFLSINPIVNQSSTAILCLILAGIVAGFLPFNWNPAKIFLGDSGSGFLGLMVATFAIISGAKLATAFLVLGIPIIDAILVILFRIKNKKSIFSADTSHLHHRFIKAGFSVKQTVLILALISLVFGLVALNSQTKQKMVAILFLIATMSIILLLLFIKNKRSKKWMKIKN